MIKRFLNIVFILFVMNSCASGNREDNLGYIFYRGLIGYEPLKVTKEIFTDNQYSFINVYFDKSPSAIFVLSEVSNEGHKWVGSNGEEIYTLNGKVIKTSDLPRNMSLTLRDNFSNAEEEIYYKLSLYNPTSYNLTASSKTECKDHKSKRFGEILLTKRCKELERIDSISVANNNIYFYFEGRPFFTKQRVHPFLPPLNLEFFYK